MGGKIGIEGQEMSIRPSERGDGEIAAACVAGRTPARVAGAGHQARPGGWRFDGLQGVVQ